MDQKIIYTITDESPALATSSLLPIVRAFTKTAGITIEEKNLSLAARILAVFPEYLTEEQRVSDDLKELGEFVKDPNANIIKLPNISASTFQLISAVKELQSKGYNIPDYPENPSGETEQEIKKRYDLIKGSAVNPVLREGNSDRRVPGAVKKFARKHPHTMGPWSKDSKTHVASMTDDDFYHTEKSIVLSRADSVKVVLAAEDGETVVLKESLPVLEGEILDSAVMRKSALRSFLRKQIADAKEKGVLLSVQLKASMMKVSDPIIFGHMISIFFEDVFDRYGEVFERLNINPEYGLEDMFSKIDTLSATQREQIYSSFEEVYRKQAKLTMVNLETGRTSLHVPSDVLIDASIPFAIKNSGKMLGFDGKMEDVKLIIPDSAYAPVYHNTIEFCKENGALDPKTLGSVANIGLMAQKAEEYGSHDKTFKIPYCGTVKVLDGSETVLMEQSVCEGDIFRMCQVKDIAVKDWVRLGVERARLTHTPALFWLDENRPHDAHLIDKVKENLKLLNTDDLEIRIMAPGDAVRFTLDWIRSGKDILSVTGNVLRDYLTDLFPILELGTSSKMLSIVSLLNGGVLFETGASGSAPMLVQQFLKEGHFQWNSLGEILALTESLEHIGNTCSNQKASVLSDALSKATQLFLENDRSPSEKVNELDTRGSHFYIMLYWARMLAGQDEDEQLKKIFAQVAQSLEENREKILKELLQKQGTGEDLGGYYLPDSDRVSSLMRPCETFNSILASLSDR